MHYIRYHSPRRQKRVEDLGCHSDWVGSADHTENGPRGKTVLLPYETVWPIISSLQFPSPHAFATYTSLAPPSTFIPSTSSPSFLSISLLSLPISPPSSSSASAFLLLPSSLAHQIAITLGGFSGFNGLNGIRVLFHPRHFGPSYPDRLKDLIPINLS